uniref:Nuclear transcription factor Y subunit n=1 Tax=Sinocyclocheilus anshuiensis TaxID=1608454 RepID=A0A671SRE9_9TELE
MEQYTTTTTASGEQIVVQASSGQIQQQVQGQPLMVQVSGGQLITSSGQPIMVQAMTGGQGQTFMQVPVSGTQGLQQIQLVQPSQIQLPGGQTLQLHGQQGQTQQIIIQQPQTAVTAGQNQGQQQITLQGQQLAQTAEGQTIVYQPVNADGTILQQGMITIPAASLAGAQLVSAGSNTNTTNTGQGTVTVTLPMAGNMVNAGGMVMYIFFPTPFQKYLHESRHRHAMARKRGDGGRFFSPKEKEEMAMQALKVSEGLELSSHWPATSAPPLG